MTKTEQVKKVIADLMCDFETPKTLNTITAYQFMNYKLKTELSEIMDECTTTDSEDFNDVLDIAFNEFIKAMVAKEPDLEPAVKYLSSHTWRTSIGHVSFEFGVNPYFTGWNHCKLSIDDVTGDGEYYYETRLTSYDTLAEQIPHAYYPQVKQFVDDIKDIIPEMYKPEILTYIS